MDFPINPALPARHGNGKTPPLAVYMVRSALDGKSSSVAIRSAGACVGQHLSPIDW